MKRALFLLLFAFAALGAYGLFHEPRQLKVHPIFIGSGKKVTKLVVVSDIHAGGLHASPDRIEYLVQVINQQRPDYVLMPGDFVDGHEPREQLDSAIHARIEAGLAKLADLEAPVIATLGNHDAWYGNDLVEADLRALGALVLINEAYRANGFCFVGLADSDTGRPDPRAYDACEPEDRVLTLMHSPDARQFVRSDSIMAFAGHTHGGQVNLPFLGRAVTSTRCGRPCAYGLVQESPPVFVTSGFGTSILPIRFRSPPEILTVELRSGEPT